MGIAALFTREALKGYGLSVLAFLKGLPRDVWYALAIVALLFNTYGNVNRWFLHWEGWKPRAERLQQTINTITNAQTEAKHKAVAQVQRVETATETHATRENTDEVASLKVQLDAADRYIAAHRVRPHAGGPGGGAGEAGAGGDPAVPPAVPADPLVAISDTDLRKCTADATYAVHAHNWAVPLNDVIQSAAAEPVPSGN